MARCHLLTSDISMTGTITFVDTGVYSTISERLLAVVPHVGEDEVFLCYVWRRPDGCAARRR